MVVNANGRPLCRHSKPDYVYRTGGLGRSCTWWCEWRTATYVAILPATVLVVLLCVLVPHGRMTAFAPAAVYGNPP